MSFLFGTNWHFLHVSQYFLNLIRSPDWMCRQQQIRAAAAVATTRTKGSTAQCLLARQSISWATPSITTWATTPCSAVRNISSKYSLEVKTKGWVVNRHVCKCIAAGNHYNWWRIWYIGCVDTRQRTHPRHHCYCHFRLLSIECFFTCAEVGGLWRLKQQQQFLPIHKMPQFRWSHMRSGWFSLLPLFQFQG